MSLIEREDINIIRYASGQYIDGYYVNGAESSIDAKANIHPATGNELLQLPEGDREKDIQKIFSLTELKNEDIITRNDTNIKYIVLKVFDHSQNDPPHYKAIMARKQYE